MLVLVCISLMLGRYPIAPQDAFKMLFYHVLPIDVTWTEQAEILFYNVRLPRIIMALMVGACLSAAGAAFQGTFQNPLASPDILGASQGAALGAAIAILMGLNAYSVSMMAFVFSMTTIIIVFIISSRAKGNRIMVTVLAGVMVSSLFSSAVSFTKLVADPTDQLPAITYWLMGSLTSVRLEDDLIVFLPLLLGSTVLLAMRWKINVLTMGDDEAATMGVNARAIRAIVALAATLLTATCVSVTGMIGWVGLVIPHLSRMAIGADYRILMPTSMLMGASFLLLVDNVSRLASTSEIPIGILTAFIGAPFFLYLITREKRK
ncbi:MAG: iron ABC transporter permease [Coriobacteriia bacterium]|nr:iron ABC transporter permease [Coriobacteriia bacterium]